MLAWCSLVGQADPGNKTKPNGPDSRSREASQAAGAAPTLRYGPAGDSAPRLRLKASGMAEREPFGPSTARSLTTRPIHPLSPREQRRPSDRPGAVQGAKRQSEPLTARTDPGSCGTRGKGVLASICKPHGPPWLRQLVGADGNELASLSRTRAVHWGWFPSVGRSTSCRAEGAVLARPVAQGT